MARTSQIARFTLALVVIAGGFSFIIGSLMGGGLSSGYDKIRGANNDPRSLLVEAVLIETDTGAALAWPTPGVYAGDAEYADMLARGAELGSSDAARVRTPAVLVQNAESGTVSVTLGGRSFVAAVTPRVIETKKGDVLRVALEIARTDDDASGTPSELSFTTAYTCAPGGVVVLDLADLGTPGSRALLGLRTTLFDPTPDP